jgi:hypothetical protein
VASGQQNGCVELLLSVEEIPSMLLTTFHSPLSTAFRVSHEKLPRLRFVKIESSLNKAKGLSQTFPQVIVIV